MKDGHFSFQTQLPKLKSNSLQEKNDHLLNIFLFSFRLNRIFQVHDMAINFSFVFAFFRSHGLSTSGNNACHRWLSKSKHLFSYEDCFERLAFGPKLFIISVNKKGYGSKVFSRNGCFLVNMSQGINLGDFRILRFQGLVFLVLERVLAGLKLQQVLMHTKLPIISSYKNLFFCLPDFRRIRKSSQIRSFMANCLSRRDRMIHWIFQNHVPWGTTHLFK